MRSIVRGDAGCTLLVIHRNSVPSIPSRSDSLGRTCPTSSTYKQEKSER